MSKEALFSEQQVALQSFVEEQREVKMLAFEAAAEKLKGQAEAEARLEEMAGRMAAQQREFEDFKKSHLQQVLHYIFQQFPPSKKGLFSHPHFITADVSTDCSPRGES